MYLLIELAVGTEIVLDTADVAVAADVRLFGWSQLHFYSFPFPDPSLNLTIAC